MAAKKKGAGKAPGKTLTEGKQRQAAKPASVRQPKAPPPAPRRKPRQPKADPIPHEVKAGAAVLGVPADQVAADLEAAPGFDPVPYSSARLALGAAVLGVKCAGMADHEIASRVIDLMRERHCPEDLHPTRWIVGRRYAETWDFQGLFLTEAEAEAVCEDGTWFIAPAVVGERLPAEPIPWPGLRYPKEAAGADHLHRQPPTEDRTSQPVGILGGSYRFQNVRIDGVHVPHHELLQHAFERSGMTANEWNAQDGRWIDARLDEVVHLLSGKATTPAAEPAATDDDLDRQLAIRNGLIILSVVTIAVTIWAIFH